MKSDEKPLGDKIRLVSKYGQKFSPAQAFSNEMDSAIIKKRQELEDAGYDVDSYDKEYEKLNQECLKEIRLAKNIWEREKISLKYNKKHNDLAKQYLDIDLRLKDDLQH